MPSHTAVVQPNTASSCQMALIALGEVLSRWIRRRFNSYSGHMSFNGCPNVHCYNLSIDVSLTYFEPGLANNFARVERPEQSRRSAWRLQNVLPWVAFNVGCFSKTRCLFVPPHRCGSRGRLLATWTSWGYTPQDFAICIRVLWSTPGPATRKFEFPYISCYIDIFIYLDYRASVRPIIRL